MAAPDHDDPRTADKRPRASSKARADERSLSLSNRRPEPVEGGRLDNHFPSESNGRAEAAEGGIQWIIGRGPSALRAARRVLDGGSSVRLIGENAAGRTVSVAAAKEASDSTPARPDPNSPCALITGTAAEALRAGQLVADRHPAEQRTGELILVGGGPGQTDLLTVRACRALARADLVLVDRLAPNDGLDELAPNALIVDVGKTPGYHPVPQHTIESEAVAHAAGGATVVRLKGGDPFVFGRGGEELAAARAAGIGVEIIPGVTSAVAVPGAAGIPITWREISRSFTVISGHAPLSEHELTHLVGMQSTIVCLMGLANLPHLVAGLIRHGMSADTPAAVVERGFHASQRTTYSEVGELISDCARVCVASPAVIVIGDVVSAAAAIANLPDAASGGEWWDPAT